MKTLLVATDLSPNGAHVAGYAYQLAKALKSKLLLCYTMNVPTEIPQNGTVAWPQELYDSMDRDSKVELAKLKDKLIAGNDPEMYQPEVACVHDAGFVTDVVNAEAIRHHAEMIIMGMHHNDRLATLMIGDHSRKMIEAAVRPLLLIPFGAEFKQIKRVAFGSDFKHPPQGLKTIQDLAVLARTLDADLVLTHISQDDDHAQYSTVVRSLLTDLMRTLPPGKVSVKVVKSKHVAKGLDWVVRHAHIDLLAMAHQEHGFFDLLMHGSRTQQAAHQIPVPLLVFNNNER